MVVAAITQRRDRQVRIHGVLTHDHSLCGSRPQTVSSAAVHALPSKQRHIRQGIATMLWTKRNRVEDSETRLLSSAVTKGIVHRHST